MTNHDFEGAGSATGIEAALPHPKVSRPARLERILENERLPGVLLLSPALILLGMFIAYPFVMGIWLSLSSISVGNPGRFVGLHNLIRVPNDSIFRTAFWNTFV